MVNFYTLPRDTTVKKLFICKIIVQNIDIHYDISIAYSRKNYKLQLSYFNLNILPRIDIISE